MSPGLVCRDCNLVIPERLAATRRRSRGALIHPILKLGRIDVSLGGDKGRRAANTRVDCGFAKCVGTGEHGGDAVVCRVDDVQGPNPFGRR